MAASGGCGCRGLMWFGPADPATTVFVPLSVCAGEPPTQYTHGGPGKVDRGSAYWAHRYTQNLAQLRYNAMIVDIHKHSSMWEQKGKAVASNLQCGKPSEVKAALDDHADEVLASTWELTDVLMGKYADGNLAVPQVSPPPPPPWPPYRTFVYGQMYLRRGSSTAKSMPCRCSTPFLATWQPQRPLRDQCRRAPAQFTAPTALARRTWDLTTGGSLMRASTRAPNVLMATSPGRRRPAGWSGSNRR